MQRAQVFITGGTGYMGRRLIPALVTRGHVVRALVRSGSEHKVPGGVSAITGNVLSRDTFCDAVQEADVVVHLVGTPKPSPRKAREFEAIDFASARECIAVAARARARHFVYVSVAHPAPVMRAYIDVRVRVEELLHESGVPYTILRPWYVLGPGHRWPYALLPFYWMLERIPATRNGARRLGLVTLPQMIAALVHAVETSDSHSRVVDVPSIRVIAGQRPA
jgi:uncharacterized protein YbjT (DUF2867 family)